MNVKELCKKEYWMIELNINDRVHDLLVIYDHNENQALITYDGKIEIIWVIPVKKLDCFENVITNIEKEIRNVENDITNIEKYIRLSSNKMIIN